MRARDLFRTLQDIKAQLGAGDRLIVVADNCTDDTAVVTAAWGAEVIVRNNSERIGKGFAMGGAYPILARTRPILFSLSMPTAGSRPT